MFEIKVDMMRVIERHDMLLFFGEQLPGAMNAAVNDTLIEVRQQAVTALSGVVNAPTEQIDRRVLIEPASRVSRIASVGAIFLSPALIPLKFFSPKQVASGVSYSPTVGKNTTVKHAFGPDIARLGKGVWRRVGKSRTPIEKIPGFSMPRSKVVMATVQRVVAGAGEILQRNIDTQVDRFITNLQSGRRTFGPTYINKNRGIFFGFGKYKTIISRNARK